MRKRSEKPTAIQQAVLNYLKAHVATRGFAPSVTEIAEAFAWSSANSAHLHLRALQARGLIKIARGVARGITIVDQEQKPDPEEMASALRVISTWASADLLDPKHVLDLCSKALRLEAA